MIDCLKIKISKSDGLKQKKDSTTHEINFQPTMEELVYIGLGMHTKYMQEKLLHLIVPYLENRRKIDSCVALIHVY